MQRVLAAEVGHGLQAQGGRADAGGGGIEKFSSAPAVCFGAAPRFGANQLLGKPAGCFCADGTPGQRNRRGAAASARGGGGPGEPRLGLLPPLTGYHQRATNFIRERDNCSPTAESFVSAQRFWGGPGRP